MNKEEEDEKAERKRHSINLSYALLFSYIIVTFICPFFRYHKEQLSHACFEGYTKEAEAHESLPPLIFIHIL